MNNKPEGKYNSLNTNNQPESYKRKLVGQGSE
jgi:hypothetical protein